MTSRCKLEEKNKLLGGHISIAGGINNAPERANSFGFNTFQLFVKSNLQWKHSNISDDEISGFIENVKKYNLKSIVAHATYLLNLSTDNNELLEKSIDDLKYEIDICNKLKISYLVLHPGSFKDRDIALKRAVEAINSLEKGKISLLVENSSGKGNTVPATINEMVYMMDNSDNNTGICIDTCHLFASGYDIRDHYSDVMAEMDSSGLLKFVKALHLNDSMFDLNSKKDRHENPGHGYIGIKGFSHIMNDNNFNNIPMIMETPDYDKNYIQNVNFLTGLIGD